MISKLDSLLKSTGGIMLNSPHNMRYFSGFSGGEGIILVTPEKRILFTDSRYTEQAADETADKGYTVIETNDPLLNAGEEISALGLAEVLFEDAEVSVSRYNRLCEKVQKTRFIAGSQQISMIRMVKTEEELEKLEKAEKIACDAFENVLGIIKPGISEIEIALELEYFMRKNGGEGASFETIAISGKKTSLPHGRPTDKKIENGDFVTMDFGCIYKGYCSDMTRTVVVGRASDEQRKIYETVREAQQKGLESIYAGVLSSDADAAARKIIEDAGYGKNFGHSLGHGVGLLIHELPNLSPRSSVILEENMVVTCEPGIYIEGFGGVRIEDMVCVKKNGIKNFTQADNKLLEL